MSEQNAEQNNDDVRARIVDLLLDRVAEDPFPSVMMMELLEELLAPDEVPAYAAVLMQKVNETKFPSATMMARLVNVSQMG